MNDNRMFCSPDNPDEQFDHWQHFNVPPDDCGIPMPFSPNGLCPCCGAELVEISEYVEGTRGETEWYEHVQCCTSCHYQSEPYYDL